MDFQIRGRMRREETIAAGKAIRELSRLVKVYGKGRWRKKKGITTIQLPDGSLRVAELHWYRGTWHREEGIQDQAVSGDELVTMGKSEEKRFAVCVNNAGYPASLELRKIYEVVADAVAEGAGYIRVVDESGDDYAYPSEYFHAIELPRELRDAVLKVS